MLSNVLELQHTFGRREREKNGEKRAHWHTRQNMDVSMCTVHAGTKWSTSHTWYKFVYSVTILCTLLKTRHCQSRHAQLSQMDGVSDVIFGHQLVASTGEHDSIRERLSSAEIMTHVSLGSGGMKLL